MTAIQVHMSQDMRVIASMCVIVGPTRDMARVRVIVGGTVRYRMCACYLTMRRVIVRDRDNATRRRVNLFAR